MPSLIDIRTRITEHPGITVRELALLFRTSEALMDAMTERLILRGDVERVTLPACPGGCACGKTAATGLRPAKR